MAEQVSSKSPPLTSEQVRQTLDAYPMLMCLTRFKQRLNDGKIMIRDRASKREVPLIPNEAQERIVKTWFKQAAMKKPLRIILPKSRKRGVSTIIEAFHRDLAKFNANWNSLTVAHQADSTVEIFDIARRMHRHDMEEGDEPAIKRTIFFPKVGSKYRCMTAMGNYGASGADTHALHISEAALLECKSGQDAENLVAMINSMPEGDGAEMTSIAIESTGNGPHGDFPARCKSAADGKSDYELVFLPWFDDPGLCDPTFTGGCHAFKPPLTDYEKGLVSDFQVTAPQLAWRRKKIANDHPDWPLDKGNPPLFGHHYPARLEECFGSVAGAVFPRLSRTRHIGTIDIAPSWQRYRAIDWGWQGEHAFVTLFVLHDPTSPPGILFDPNLPSEVFEEFQSYAVDPRTGHPINRNNHSCLAGNTIITTDSGCVAIENLIASEGRVMTPIGWCDFWNVHQVGVKQTWRLTFDDGSHIDATGDHEFYVNRRFMRVQDIQPGDVAECFPDEPGGRFGEVAAFYGQPLPSTQGREVLFQRSHSSASRRLEASFRGHSEWLSHSSSQGPNGQFNRQSPMRLGAGSLAQPHDAGAMRAGAKEHSHRAEGSAKVGQNTSRKSVSFEPCEREFNGDVGETEVSYADLCDLRTVISDAMPATSHASFLRPQLQNDGSAAQARDTAAHHAHEMRDLREGLCRAAHCFNMQQGVRPKTLQIIKKEPLGIQPVYDLTVDNAHCLLMANGIAASNCDALRYLVTTAKLHGFCYVYRAIHQLGAAHFGAAGMARKIHEMSGWYLPAGEDFNNLRGYIPGPTGETFTSTVADSRNAGGYITQFCEWGIPTIAATKPDKRDDTKGEVWDGIRDLSVIINGDALFSSPHKDPTNQIIVDAYRNLSGSHREIMLSEEQRKVAMPVLYGSSLRAMAGSEYDEEDQIPMLDME